MSVAWSKYNTFPRWTSRPSRSLTGSKCVGTRVQGAQVQRIGTPHKLLSTFAYNFNLHLYSLGCCMLPLEVKQEITPILRLRLVSAFSPRERDAIETEVSFRRLSLASVKRA